MVQIILQATRGRSSVPLHQFAKRRCSVCRFLDSVRILFLLYSVSNGSVFSMHGVFFPARPGRGSGGRRRRVCTGRLSEAGRRPSGSGASRTACWPPTAELRLLRAPSSRGSYRMWRRRRSHRRCGGSGSRAVEVHRGRKGCRGSRWTEGGTAGRSRPGQRRPKTRRLQKRGGGGLETAECGSISMFTIPYLLLISVRCCCFFVARN